MSPFESDDEVEAEEDLRRWVVSPSRDVLVDELDTSTTDRSKPEVTALAVIFEDYLGELYVGLDTFGFG